ncbi:MAG TPA: hypothetical protein VK960_05475 [Acidimicrobiia bacterium]|nr:hypothetical protein [Acidimicrobiia bacterium]
MTLVLMTALGVAERSMSSATAGARPIAAEAREYGFNDLQIESLLSHSWDIQGATQMYGFADDPLGEPGVDADEAAGTVPTAIGIEYVRFTDPQFLPPSLDGTIVDEDELLIPLGTGAMELDRLYVWFWAEMEGPVPFDEPDIGLNIAWPFYVEGSERYASSFPGDSWTGASHIAGFYNEAGQSDPSLAWFAGLFINDGGALRTYEDGGGLAWADGSTVGMYVPADAFMQRPEQRIAEYGYAGDIVLNPEFRFDPDAPRKVTVYPANFGSDGRQGGLEPVYDDEERFTINVGFAPQWDLIGARLFWDEDEGLWANLRFLEPWPTVDTTSYWLDQFFSAGLQVAAQYDSTTSPLLGTEFHAGEHSLFGTSPSGEEVMPSAIWVMSDGSVNFHLGIDRSMVPSESDMITLYTGTAFWVDEDTTERQAVGNQFPVPIGEIETEDPAGDGVDLYRSFDLVTDQGIAPPPSATTSTSTTRAASTVTTDAPGESTSDSGGSSILLILLVVVIALVLLWLLWQWNQRRGSEPGTSTGTPGIGRTRERGGHEDHPGDTAPPIAHGEHIDSRECGWGLYFHDGTAEIAIREPAKGQHLCCKYVVRVTTDVVTHKQAARGRQDDDAERLRIPDFDYGWRWVDFSANASTRSGPAGRLDWMQGLGDPKDKPAVPLDPYWQEGPEPPQVAAHLEHREITDVDITLEAKCPEYRNLYSVSAESDLELLATQECTNDAGDPCPVELNAFGFVGGWITGPGNIFAGVADWTGTDPDELERSPLAESRMRAGGVPHVPSDSHDHVERDRATYEVSENDRASDAVERDDLLVTIENDVDIVAGQIVPREVYATTERVTAHIDAALEHDLQIQVDLTPIDCEKNDCGGHGECACKARWKMRVSGRAGSWIDAGEGPFEILRDPTAGDRMSPVTGKRSWIGKS